MSTATQARPTSAARNEYSAEVWMDLSDIDPRPACEVRSSQDEDAIAQYAEDWASLPPIRVARDTKGNHWTEDGGHRYRCAEKAGKTQIKCVVRNVKDYVEAFQAACRANEENRAVRVTNADKRHRVEVALKHPEMSGWSNRLIAERCGVSPQTVNTLRSDPQLANLASSKPTVGKDGKARGPRKSLPSEPVGDDGTQEISSPIPPVSLLFDPVQDERDQPA